MIEIADIPSKILGARAGIPAKAGLSIRQPPSAIFVGCDGAARGRCQNRCGRRGTRGRRNSTPSARPAGLVDSRQTPPKWRRCAGDLSGITARSYGKSEHYDRAGGLAFLEGEGGSVSAHGRCARRAAAPARAGKAAGLCLTEEQFKWQKREQDQFLPTVLAGPRLSIIGDDRSLSEC